jgi:hypothetical protein
VQEDGVSQALVAPRGTRGRLALPEGFVKREYGFDDRAGTQLRRGTPLVRNVRRKADRARYFRRNLQNPHRQRDEDPRRAKDGPALRPARVYLHVFSPPADFAHERP